MEWWLSPSDDEINSWDVLGDLEMALKYLCFLTISWCKMKFNTFLQRLFLNAQCVDHREVLDHLLRLGFYYRELDNFCVQSRNLSWINSNQQPLSPGSKLKQPSVYCRALANGIAEVLAVYRAAVLQVERSLMSDPVPVLASVTQGLYQVRPFLRNVVSHQILLRSFWISKLKKSVRTSWWISTTIYVGWWCFLD